MTLTLDRARTILDTALETARSRELAGVGLVVTDLGGQVIAALRTDAAGVRAIAIATAKARTAIAFKRATLKMSAFRDNAAVTAALNGVLDGDFLPLGGGVAIAGSDGAAIGAAACAGGAPELDDEIISAAVTAAGLGLLG